MSWLLQQSLFNTTDTGCDHESHRLLRVEEMVAEEGLEPPTRGL